MTTEQEIKRVREVIEILKAAQASGTAANVPSMFPCLNITVDPSAIPEFIKIFEDKLYRLTNSGGD